MLKALSSIKLSPSWLAVLEEQFSMSYMQELKGFLQQRKQQGATILPPSEYWFNALNLTDFEQVKVVILGQDPYHGINQAHGLSFSVLPPTPAPPSLINIFRELEDDLAIEPPHAVHTDLSVWATQGVLLLNAVLTVEVGQAASHANHGWETFTDAIITVLNEQRENIVFILWGNYARKKGGRINQNKHCIIHSPHPSPLSSYRGFFGSKPFSQANDYLLQHRISPIDWQIIYK